MMCEECGIRPASIHLTTIAQGEKTEKNLCPVCMAKYHKLPGMGMAGIAGILNNLMMPGPQKEEQGIQDDEASPDMICPECGTTYEEFRKTGLVGCPHCYQEFREPLNKLLNKVHGSVRHAGKVPDAGRGGVTLGIMLDSLRHRLRKAIENEEYEEAALLRDKIRVIERQMSAESGEEKHE